MLMEGRAAAQAAFVVPLYGVAITRAACRAQRRQRAGCPGMPPAFFMSPHNAFAASPLSRAVTT